MFGQGLDRSKSLQSRRSARYNRVLRLERLQMSLRVLKNVPLRNYNYLRFDSVAEKFAVLEERAGISELCSLVQNAESFKILGDGSNVVMKASRFPLLLHVGMKGIEYSSDRNEVLVKVAAGESWSELVDVVAARGLYGIESLALIPGSMGAAPVQNIGAYGQEVGNVIHEVEVLDLQTGQVRLFSAMECQFEYRNSIFKRPESRYLLILSVTMRLQQQSDLTAEKPVAIAEKIKATRRSKLPDPKTHPNVGSFFHNPVLSPADIDRLKRESESMPVFPHGDGFKVPAAWFIEQAGWKGYRDGDVGISEKHALVMVNHGASTAEPLLALAAKIVADVKAKFGVRLTMEPALFDI